MTRSADQDVRGREPDQEVSDVPGFSFSARFLRGLTLGALVGAAIAGSAIWDRHRRRDDTPASPNAELPRDPG